MAKATQNVVRLPSGMVVKSVYDQMQEYYASIIDPVAVPATTVRSWFGPRNEVGGRIDHDAPDQSDTPPQQGTTAESQAVQSALA